MKKIEQDIIHYQDLAKHSTGELKLLTLQTVDSLQILKQEMELTELDKPDHSNPDKRYQQ